MNETGRVSRFNRSWGFVEIDGEQALFTVDVLRCAGRQTIDVGEVVQCEVLRRPGRFPQIASIVC